jgi:L-alanine-DL-glutamate epimerase-like enolase superfamily enzyme
MPLIRHAHAMLVEIPVETMRTDAVQSFVKQETIFVDMETDDGTPDRGYSYAIGTGGRAVLSMLHDHLLPAVVGQDMRRPEAVWRQLFSQTRATTVGAVTSLALAAIDIAVCDARCRRNGEPLWRAAGGSRRRIVRPTLCSWLQQALPMVASRLHTIPSFGFVQHQRTCRLLSRTRTHLTVRAVKPS